MCDGAYGCLSVPTGISKCLMESEGGYWCLKVTTGA